MNLIKRAKKAYQAFNSDDREIIVLNRSEFTAEQAQKITEETGKIALLVSDMNNVKLMNDDIKNGDGQAAFLGEGTTEEFDDMLRADKGMDKWYKRILRS